MRSKRHLRPLPIRRPRSRILEQLEQRLLLSIRIDDVTAPEGDDGSTEFNFTVTLDEEVAGGVTVEFETQDGTATVADRDYDPIELVADTAIVFGGFNLTRGGTMSLSQGSFVGPMRQSLLANFPESTILETAELTPEFLATIDVLVLGNARTFTAVISPLSPAEQSALRAFVESGGGALILVDNDQFAGASTDVTNESLIDAFGLDVSGTLNGFQIGTVDAVHPITDGPFGQVGSLQANFPGSFDAINDAQVISNWAGLPGVVAINPGDLAVNSGGVVMVADTSVFSDLHILDNETLLLNAVSFLRPTHAAAASSDAPLTFVGMAGEQQVITVAINGDAKVEPDENFIVRLTSVQAAGPVEIIRGEGIGTILNDDFAPAADAGGPYTVDEGASITLDATKSSDADADIVEYTWDLDADGEFDDATGATPTLDAGGLDGGLDGDATFNIAVQVADAGGNVDTATTTVVVENVAPTITRLSSVSTAQQGVPITLTATATDPAAADPLTYTYDFGDGAIPQSGIDLTSVQHVFTELGEFTVRLTIDDGDGGSAVSMLAVVVGPKVDLDFGDARHESKFVYPVQLADDGARHVIQPGFHLGALIDDEPDGAPSQRADGDDGINLADEDGVEVVGELQPDRDGELRVTVTDDAGLGGFVDIWIDFDASGDWESSEHVNGGQSIPVTAGSNIVRFHVPPGATNGGGPGTTLRARLSRSGGLTTYGLAPDGEIEDHFVTISPARALIEGRYYVDANGDGEYQEGVDNPLAGFVRFNDEFNQTTAARPEDGIYRFTQRLSFAGTVAPVLAPDGGPFVEILPPGSIIDMIDVGGPFQDGQAAADTDTPTAIVENFQLIDFNGKSSVGTSTVQIEGESTPTFVVVPTSGGAFGVEVDGLVPRGFISLQMRRMSESLDSGYTIIVGSGMTNQFVTQPLLFAVDPDARIVSKLPQLSSIDLPERFIAQSIDAVDPTGQILAVQATLLDDPNVVRTFLIAFDPTTFTVLGVRAELSLGAVTSLVGDIDLDGDRLVVGGTIQQSLRDAPVAVTWTASLSDLLASFQMIKAEPVQSQTENTFVSEVTVVDARRNEMVAYAGDFLLLGANGESVVDRDVRIEALNDGVIGGNIGGRGGLSQSGRVSPVSGYDEQVNNGQAVRDRDFVVGEQVDDEPPAVALPTIGSNKPVVVIGSPLNVLIVAEDNQQVTAVELFVNGELQELPTQIRERAWEATVTPEGNEGDELTIEAKATDSAGNVNSITRIVVLGRFDWGDAPDQTVDRAVREWTYPTRREDDGARHRVRPGFELRTATRIVAGSGVSPEEINNTDAELNGQPSSRAIGDDNTGKDEQGVFLFDASPGLFNLNNSQNVLFAGREARAWFDVVDDQGKGGFVDGWIDFNIDGDWLDPGEKIINSVFLRPGERFVTFDVPLDAVDPGPGFQFALHQARFRFSDTGGLDPTTPGDLPDDQVPFGEVEDHLVKVVGAPVALGGRVEVGAKPLSFCALLAVNLFEVGDEADSSSSRGDSVQRALGSPSPIAVAEADDNCRYLFPDLAPGQYMVEAAYGGELQQRTVAVAAGDVILNSDFAFSESEVALGSIGDRVYEDANGDGAQDSDEGGISGLTVNLDGVGMPSLQTLTAADGSYSFRHLPAGEYTVSITDGRGELTNFTRTTPQRQVDITLASGENVVNADWGYQRIPGQSAPSVSANVEDVTELQFGFLPLDVSITDDGPIDESTLNDETFRIVRDDGQSFRVYYDATGEPLETAGTRTFLWFYPGGSLGPEDNGRYELLRSAGGIADRDGNAPVRDEVIDQFDVIFDVADDAFDFGDAPQGSLVPGGPEFAAYPTMGLDAARHIIAPGLSLGATRPDGEPAGRPSTFADADDVSSAPSADDGDGIVFKDSVSGLDLSLPDAAVGRDVPSMLLGQFMTIDADLRLPNDLDEARLSGWIDWNRDGDWLDPGEYVVQSALVSGGPQRFDVQVPLDAAAGLTFARFRLSTQFGLGPSGGAPDGEVEDYVVRILELVAADFDGDGVVDDRDIDRINAAIAASSQEPAFDLDGNGVVDGEDRKFLVEKVLGTHSGDADLNGTTNFVDFLTLAANFAVAGVGWRGGEFDGNGAVDFVDFLQLAANFGKSRPDGAVAAEGKHRNAAVDPAHKLVRSVLAEGKDESTTEAESYQEDDPWADESFHEDLQAATFR